MRPYQNFLYADRRISNIHFAEGKSTRYVSRNNIGRYYLRQGRSIYTDKIADFACRCNDASGGLVARRLSEIYDLMLIDESQDLAGYDFEVLEMLLGSLSRVAIVGDCRQSTYFTNCSPKNKKFKGYNILQLFGHWEQSGLCRLTQRTDCYRCNQAICDFADALYPELKRTTSMTKEVTGHDGVFVVPSATVLKYYSIFQPVVLRDSVRTSTANLPARNFGFVKGKTFDRVLVFPNGPIRKYLLAGQGTPLAPRTRAGLYVAITRAKHSVAFVLDGSPGSSGVEMFS